MVPKFSSRDASDVLESSGHRTAVEVIVTQGATVVDPSDAADVVLALGAKTFPEAGLTRDLAAHEPVGLIGPDQAP